jgi:hypothetical protein
MYCDATIAELRGARALRMKHSITTLIKFHADAYPTRVWRELGAITQALDFARECEKNLIPGRVARIPENTRTGAHARAGGVVVPETVRANLRRLRMWAMNHPALCL